MPATRCARPVAAEAPSRPPRPVPAASLIALWQHRDGMPRLLMGRRHPSLAFLPDVLVFPGGRLEVCDTGDVPDLCSHSTGWLASEAAGTNGRTLVACALRECAEETGVSLLGRIERPLRYVARAITPPGFPRRYDTRFLLVVLDDRPEPPQPDRGDGELIEPSWHRADRLDDHNLHPVTRAVLHFVLGTWAGPAARPLLVADRTPHGWAGQKALRSRHLGAGAPRPS